jgi:hypothetical protein
LVEVAIYASAVYAGYKVGQLLSEDTQSEGDAAPPTSPEGTPTDLTGETAGAKSGDKDPSTPVGKRGSPLDVADGTNKPEAIGGRDYGGHALDQMQGRGVTPTPVEDTIQNGTQTPGNKPGRIVHTSQDGRLKVVTEGGKVITVITK